MTNNAKKHDKDQLIAIDLFGTLIEEGNGRPDRRYSDLVLELSPKDRRADVQRRLYPFVRGDLMTVKLGYREMVGRILDHFQLEASPQAKDAIVDAWSQSNKSMVWRPGAKEFLGNLSDVRLATRILASNVTAPAWDEVNKGLHVEGYFDGTMLSCEIGYSKPSDEFWNNLRRLGRAVKPRGTWMVGDSLSDDLRVPFSRGWNVVDATKPDAFTMLNGILCRPASPSKTIILNVDDPESWQNKLKTFGFNFLDPKKLCSYLGQWAGWDLFDRQTTLLLFPGRGGSQVKSMLGADWLNGWPNQLPVDVKRCWEPGADPIVLGGNLDLNRVFPQIKNVVIVDDVISSGKTALAVLEKNTVWFPDAKWWGACLVGQNSVQLTGFNGLFVAAEVGSRESKWPLNSLSTLICDPIVRDSYVTRNFPDRGTASSLLSILSANQLGN
ncbi:HAD hydrolase-like protein [Candidatus Gracilibacteria bacterium]|nr:HAD hydrolase-like protein [Candidatus Gracilibacteria bacterium]